MIMVMIIIIIIIGDTKDSYWRVVGLPRTDRRRQKETFVWRRGNLPESGEWRFDKQEEMADKRFWKYILAKSLLVKIEKSLSALILDLLNYSILSVTLSIFVRILVASQSGSMKWCVKTVSIENALHNVLFVQYGSHISKCWNPKTTSPWKNCLWGHFSFVPLGWKL